MILLIFKKIVEVDFSLKSSLFPLVLLCCQSLLDIGMSFLYVFSSLLIEAREWVAYKMRYLILHSDHGFNHILVYMSQVAYLIKHLALVEKAIILATFSRTLLRYQMNMAFHWYEAWWYSYSFKWIWFEEHRYGRRNFRAPTVWLEQSSPGSVVNMSISSIFFVNVLSMTRSTWSLEILKLRPWWNDRKVFQSMMWVML